MGQAVSIDPARRILVAAAFVLALSACAARSTTPVADPIAVTMVADRLFFGRAIPDGGIVSDAGWTAFLEDVVTQAFPDGLTVWRAEGQWLDEEGLIVREPVMVVEVIHPPSPEADAAIAEIANEYRRRFRQDAVLRVTAGARVRFFE